MTLISDNYMSYVPYPSPQSICLTDKSTIDAIGEVTVKIFTMVDHAKHEVHLQHTLLVPTLANSLFSVKTMNCLGYLALFRPYGVFIKNPNEITIAESEPEKGGSLYDLHIVHNAVPVASTTHTPAWLTIDILHKHLGHPSSSTLQ